MNVQQRTQKDHVVLGMDQIGQSHDPSVFFLDTDFKHMSAEWGFAYTKSIGKPKRGINPCLLMFG